MGYVTTAATTSRHCSKHFASSSDVARNKKQLPRDLLKPLPRREELEALARHYHHVQNEHKRAPLESSMRRRIAERLLDVRQRFDRLLQEWVPEEKLRPVGSEHLPYPP